MRSRLSLLASLALGGALLLSACGDDNVAEAQKAEVDAAKLQSGPTVTLTGNTGTVDVPLAIPMPAASEADVEAELEGAVAVVVSSVETGATADLAAGSLVSSNPSAAGEYTWAINDARDVISLEFFNGTPGGLTLKEGRAYSVQFAVATNDYVKSMAAITFNVTPSGG